MTWALPATIRAIFCGIFSVAITRFASLTFGRKIASS
jgi:hypothetical protein